MIKVTSLDLKEVLVLEYESTEDSRGTTYKLFSKMELEEAGIFTEFVEEILYCPARKGTLYGIHFQNHPKAQAKLLCCTKGRGLDFAIDLRKGSDTYKKWTCIELTPQNKKQIYIPVGFGHVFLSLEDDTHVIMRIDKCFDQELYRVITYADTEINIKIDVENPILSEKDKIATSLKECDCNL